MVERILREREEREEFGREIERKEREIREQRARKRREREAWELEEASRWPQQQEQITGRSQWLCEHYQRHCRVRFPCCSHFYSCHRCHNNSKACDNEEAKASHATHLKCSFCHHEQEVSVFNSIPKFGFLLVQRNWDCEGWRREDGVGLTTFSSKTHHRTCTVRS